MMNEMNELNESNEMTNKGANHMKKMKQLLKNQKGMTLIELLAVIVILAIVAAIAVPAIGNIIENSRIKAAKADAVNILNAANLYFVDNSEETSFTNEKTAGYLEAESDVIKTFEVTKGNPTTITTSALVGKGFTIEFKAAGNSDIDVSSPKSDDPKVIVTSE